jgi:hypothetical protein
MEPYKHELRVSGAGPSLIPIVKSLRKHLLS